MFIFDVAAVTDDNIKENFICPFCGKRDWEVSEDNNDDKLNTNIKIVICKSCGHKTKFTQ